MGSDMIVASFYKVTQLRSMGEAVRSPNCHLGEPGLGVTGELEVLPRPALSYVKVPRRQWGGHSQPSRLPL